MMFQVRQVREEPEELLALLVIPDILVLVGGLGL